MFLPYCDETNLEERSGDFFVYGGIAINSSTAKSLSHKIDKIRNRWKVPNSFKLKFNPAPEPLSNAAFIKLKQELIETAITHDVKLLVYVILHDISLEPDVARRNGINTICYHFDCMLNGYLRPGVVLIDRFSDNQIDQLLVEKFSTGVTGLPFSKELRLANVLGFHYSAVGQSHFSSLIDIVLGSLRFSINAFTRNDASRMSTATTLIKLISPLFHRESSGRVSEISFHFSPKTIKVDQYRAQYMALKKFLADNGADTAHAPMAPGKSRVIAHLHHLETVSQQSVIVWDLETVPDLAAAARMLDLPEATDTELREALGAGFPKHPLHKIACIGALVASRHADGWHLDALGAPHMGERPEGRLISDFIEKIGQLRPQLITFNGHSFDLPVLRYRAMVNRISAIGLQVRPYFHRYTEDALDLCDVLGSYVPGAKVKLDDVSKILGLTGKPEGIDGSRVEEMILGGQIEEVSRYCESDVVNTYRVWLVYELFRGAITADELDWSERQLRDFVQARKTANPHLNEALRIPNV